MTEPSYLRPQGQSVDADVEAAIDLSIRDHAPVDLDLSGTYFAKLADAYENSLSDRSECVSSGTYTGTSDGEAWTVHTDAY